MAAEIDGAKLSTSQCVWVEPWNEFTELLHKNDKCQNLPQNQKETTKWGKKGIQQMVMILWRVQIVATKMEGSLDLSFHHKTLSHFFTSEVKIYWRLDHSWFILIWIWFPHVKCLEISRFKEESETLVVYDENLGQNTIKIPYESVKYFKTYD